MDVWKFEFLTFLRGGAYAVKIYKPSGNDPSLNSNDFEILRLVGYELDPYELVAFDFNVAWPGLDSERNGEAWWERLMHRCIIFYALVIKTVNSETGKVNVEIDGHLVYALNKVTRLLTTDVAETYPEEAEKLAKRLKTCRDVIWGGTSVD